MKLAEINHIFLLDILIIIQYRKLRAHMKIKFDADEQHVLMYNDICNEIFALHIVKLHYVKKKLRAQKK